MELSSQKLGLCDAYLSANKMKLVLAESMTAGYVASVISLLRKSGDYFLGSIVCYHDNMKIESLKVDPNLLDRYGGVSAQVTAELIKGLQHIYNPEVAIAVTGFAYESAVTSLTNPVGTVYINIQSPDFDFAKKCIFKGSPEEIIKEATIEIIENLYESILLSQACRKSKL
ncbi:CinA family protein [Sphingobacterium sp. MYb382]|uniref:CinA family protein n=1 Tax=Sphingobacterium sp. MYb382 TaxID=2745278 RepID=UPI0030B6FB25